MHRRRPIFRRGLGRRGGTRPCAASLRQRLHPGRLAFVAPPGRWSATIDADPRALVRAALPVAPILSTATNPDAAMTLAALAVRLGTVAARKTSPAGAQGTIGWRRWLSELRRSARVVEGEDWLEITRPRPGARATSRPTTTTASMAMSPLPSISRRSARRSDVDGRSRASPRLGRYFDRSRRRHGRPRCDTVLTIDGPRRGKGTLASAVAASRLLARSGAVSRRWRSPHACWRERGESRRWGTRPRHGLARAAAPSSGRRRQRFAPPRAGGALASRISASHAFSGVSRYADVPAASRPGRDGRDMGTVVSLTPRARSFSPRAPRRAIVVQQ